MKSTIGNAAHIAGKIWDIVIIVAVVLLLAMKFVPMALGYQVFVCQSNSMAPTFHTGSLCYIDTKYDTNNIQKGDIIAFKMNNGALVTHRAHDFTRAGLIITKGDANEDVDISPVSKSQVFGENVLQIEHIGMLYDGFPNMLLISIIVFALTVKAIFALIAKLCVEKKE